MFKHPVRVRCDRPLPQTKKNTIDLQTHLKPKKIPQLSSVSTNTTIPNIDKRINLNKLIHSHSDVTRTNRRQRYRLTLRNDNKLLDQHITLPRPNNTVRIDENADLGTLSAECKNEKETKSTLEHIVNNKT